ncbi:MAG: hypothetical protein LBK18_05640 [Prevotellaceae bacterium]|jgi:hypothetical protein|nr:hypothetical protein [Prevotellaceae bacterium]
MANLRKIKKDITFLVGEVVSDCYLLWSFRPNGKEQELESILLEAAELHSSLHQRVNAAPKDGVKQHYRAISGDLLREVDKLFSRVSELAK